MKLALGHTPVIDVITAAEELGQRLQKTFVTTGP